MSSLSSLKIKQSLFASIVVSYKISLRAAAAAGKQLTEQFQWWVQGGKSQAVGSIPCGKQNGHHGTGPSPQTAATEGDHLGHVMCLVPCVTREGKQHFA